MNNNKWKYKISIIGLGNYIMGDDGAGIHLIKKLREEKVLAGVNLIEVGTSLLYYLEEISQSKQIIAVDAIKGGEKAGTVYKLNLDNLKENKHNNLHGFSFFDLIKTSQSITGFPQEIKIYGIEPKNIYLQTELSKPVKNAINQLKNIILDYCEMNLT